MKNFIIDDLVKNPPEGQLMRVVSISDDGNLIVCSWNVDGDLKVESFPKDELVVVSRNPKIKE